MSAEEKSRRLVSFKELLGTVPGQALLVAGPAALARKKAVESHAQDGTLTEEEGVAVGRLMATFEAVYLVAAADGNVSPQEAEELSRMLAEVTEGRIEPSGIELIFRSCEASLAREGAERRAKDIAKKLASEDDRRAAFVLAVGVAFVDGKVDQKERAMFSVLGSAFGLSDETKALIAQIEDAVAEFRGDA